MTVTMTSAPRATLTASWMRVRLSAGSADHHAIAGPVGGVFGDAHAFGMHHPHAGARGGGDAAERIDAAPRSARVAAEMQALCVGADHRERFDAAAIQRQQVAGVLQQDERLARRLERDGLVLRGVGDALGLVGVDERPLEQPGEELGAQHPRHRAVDERRRDAPVTRHRLLARESRAGRAVRYRRRPRAPAAPPPPCRAPRGGA